MRRAFPLLAALAALLVWLAWPRGGPAAPSVEAPAGGPPERSAAARAPETVAPDGSERRPAPASADEPEASALAAPEASGPAELRFHGLVLSRGDGAPVPALEVELVAAAEDARVELDPSAAGRFLVRHAPPAGLPLRVGAPGFAPRYLATDTLHTTREDALVVRLGPAAGLDARVLDAGGGPLPDVEVRLELSATALREVGGLVAAPYPLEARRFAGRTGFDGAATIADLPTGVPLAVTLVREGEVLRRGDDPLLLVAGTNRRTWRVGAGATVLGVVREVGGAPVPDVEVWRKRGGVDMPLAFRAEMRPSLAEIVRTDADGRFEMEGVVAGRWWIGLAPGGRFVSLSPAVAVDASEAVVRVDIVAHPALRIAGRVVGPDGEPVDAARVVATREGALISLDADLAGTGGRFTLEPALPGSYSIGAGTPAGDLRASEPVEVEAGDEDVVLVLRPGALVQGRVVDARSGEPVPAEIVVSPVVSGGEDQGFSRIASHQSEFELGGFEAGEHDVFARSADGRVGLLRVRARPRGEWREPVEVRVGPGATLSLSNAGAVGCSYRLWAGEALVAWSAIPAGGEVELTMPPGELRVRWRPQGSRVTTDSTAVATVGERVELTVGLE
jgi:hypothetical protein